jgi:vacuolar-type H+-ATPase subunit F/Vma7
MRRILLSVGTSHALIRNAVFVNAGYGVVPAKTCSGALRLIESRDLDAVIVGHSLSRDVKERITAAAKTKRLPVVVLHPSQSGAHQAC